VPKAPSTEDALAAIHAIRRTPARYDFKRDLAPLLRHKSNHVVAAAAATAETLEAGALAPELVEAFERLIGDAPKRDPGCKALITIARALVQMDDPAAKVYFAGIRHVQMEGSFGSPVDVAAPLRGLCARGLARMGHPDALMECVTLLTDPQVAARAGAIRAIAEAGRPEGVLLLRLKASVGDPEDEILGECFSALLALDPAPSVEFVAKFLESRSAAAGEQAALALGESRQPAAFQVLRQAWERGGTSERRRTMLVAIAMLRSDDALEFLLRTLSEESGLVAADALAGLALYARDEAVRSRVGEIVRQRGEPDLEAVFAREFGSA
jgi:hypothetical protein